MTRLFHRLAAARLRQSLEMMPSRFLTTAQGQHLVKLSGYDTVPSRRYSVRTR